MILFVSHDIFMNRSAKPRSVAQHDIYRYGAQRKTRSIKDSINKAVNFIVVALEFLQSYTGAGRFVLAMKVVQASKAIYCIVYSVAIVLKGTIMVQMRMLENPEEVSAQSNFTGAPEASSFLCIEEIFPRRWNLSSILQLSCMSITDREHLKTNL